MLRQLQKKFAANLIAAVVIGFAPLFNIRTLRTIRDESKKWLSGSRANPANNRIAEAIFRFYDMGRRVVLEN